MVGAVTGIGLVESVSGRRPATEHGVSKRAFNWILLLKFFAGWVATLVVAGLTAAGELPRRLSAAAHHRQLPGGSSGQAAAELCIRYWEWRWSAVQIPCHDSHCPAPAASLARPVSPTAPCPPLPQPSPLKAFSRPTATPRTSAWMTASTSTPPPVSPAAPPAASWAAAWDADHAHQLC